MGDVDHKGSSRGSFAFAVGQELQVSGAQHHLLSQAVGVLSSAYTSGWLIGRVGARPVLALMACFPLLMCGTAFLIKEERRRSPTSPRSARALEKQRSPRSPTSAGDAELRTGAGAPSRVDEEEKEGLLGDNYIGRGGPEAHHRAHPEGECCPRSIM